MSVIYYANQKICTECGKVLSRDVECCTSCGSRSLSLIRCEPPWDTLGVGGKVYRVLLLTVAAVFLVFGVSQCVVIVISRLTE